jgi:hypothetical protein
MVLAADPPCLATATSGLVTYGTSTQTATVKIEKVIPNYCVRFNYSGNAMWTTANEKGGLSCKGPQLVIDYNLANTAFNGVTLRQFTPAACGQPQQASLGAPPAPTDSMYVYYGKTTDMHSVKIKGTTTACYQINYSGNSVWFPKSAYAYRADFVGNPPGLDYNARKYSAC